MKVAIICTALLGLLLFVLGLVVSSTRGSTGKAGAYPQDPADPLFKRIRAHANTAEYAPMLDTDAGRGQSKSGHLGSLDHGDRDREPLPPRGGGPHELDA